MSKMQFSENVLNELPYYILWKDKNSKYLGANDATARIFGFKHKEDLIGLTDNDMKCSASEAADLFRAQDLEVLTGQKECHFLNLHTYANNFTMVHLTTKKPFYDERGQIQGVLCFVRDLRDSYDLKAILNLLKHEENREVSGADQINKVICERFTKANLSEKETEILYYIVQGRSAKEIGIIMYRSKRTIEDCIENIKIKTGCVSKSELILYALSVDFISIIPKKILQKELSLRFK